MRILMISAAVLGFGTFSAVAGCPDPSSMGETYRFSGNQLYSAKTFDLRAGGGEKIEYCPISTRTDSGSGFVTETPDYSFDLSGMDPYELVVSVSSSCDAVLLINTGVSNWYYDDDDGPGDDPQIRLSNPSNGWLDVWVGTYDGGTCPATLKLETF